MMESQRFYIFALYLSDTMERRADNQSIVIGIKMKVILLVILFATFLANAQEYGRFDHFGTEDGLISDRVYNITFDQNGFLWLATDFGFDRFDGKTFKHHQKKDYPTLRREDVLICHLGDNNNLFLGGYHGLLEEYDQERDTLIDHIPDVFVTGKPEETEGFYVADDGRRFAMTTKGIFLYDPETHAFRSDTKIYEGTKETYIKSMYVDKYGRYWVGSLDKYYVYDSSGELIVECDPPIDACGFIWNLLPIGDDKLLVTTQTHEMWVFDIQDTIGKPTVLNVPFGNTVKVLRDKNNRYWFATDGFGLWYTDDEISEKARFHSVVPYNSQGLEIRKIYCMTLDSAGNVWLGTRNSGIWCYRGNDLTNISFSRNYGFPAVACTGISEDKQGNLVVGSDGSGVYYVSPDFRNIELVELENNNVCSAVVKENGDVIVPTWGGGTFNIDARTKAVSKEDFSGMHLPSRCYFGACRYGQTLYACSAGDGLYKKEGDKDWQKIILKNDTTEVDRWAFKAIDAPDNTTWALTSTALWRLRNGRCDLIPIKGLEGDKLSTLSLADGACDDEGNLYVTSNKGFFVVEAGKDECELSDFVPACSYHSIQKDDNGLFWLAGDNGIARVDVKKKSFRLLTDSRNNIALHYFIFRSGFKDSRGRIHFGTNDGFVTLDPAHLSMDTDIPYLAFSDLYISNNKVKRGSGPLKDCNLWDGHLSLEYDQTDITIHFDAIDYSEFDPIQYRYKLSNLREDWVDLSGGKYVQFSHLPAGEYQLTIEAFRNNVECVPKQINLTIKVLPPWWETLWFRALLAIVLTLIVGSIILLRIKRLMNAKKELEQKVDERTSELKEALNDKDRLISVVAHDLKNPMFAIVGALENLTKGNSNLGEQERQRITVSTYDSAKTLQNEMLKILDWAQSKKEDITCHPSDVDVQSVIQNVSLLLSSVMVKKEIRLETDIHLTHFAFADPRMLEAVIRNLLSNAIKFTPEGGTISILSWMDNKNVKIAVKDTGVGMNAEQVERLRAGQSSVSTKGTNNETGNGLGYRICRNYILRNNGTMDVASEPGNGTTITITLPSSERKIEIRDELRLSGTKVDEDYSILTGNTAIVIDDNPLICENVKTLLSSYLNVLTANNGKEALEIIEQKKPDIILSDVEMPVMNGIEMSRIIEQSAETEHIPLLFLSARNEDSDRLIGLKSGAVDYIPKPFSPEELLLKVCNILKMRQKQQQYLLSQFMLERRGQSAEETQPEEEEKQTKRVNPFVKQFLEVIEKRYTESDITIEDIAQDMFLSKSTLTRRTNSIIGKTPLEVLNEFRLNEAMRQLKNADSETQISDIAYNVGFSDPAYFSRRFKEYFGTKPSQVIDRGS